MQPSSRSDLVGRIIGMIVFLLGVVLLVMVFNIAYGLFHTAPDAVLGLNFTGNPKTDPTATAIASRFGVLLINIVYLFIMAIAGSLVAQSGIKLYFSAVKGPTPEVISHHVTNPAPAPPPTAT